MKSVLIFSSVRVCRELSFIVCMCVCLEDLLSDDVL